MQVCEPRLVRDQQATSSLVYNIDFARGKAYELRYLVNIARTYYTFSSFYRFLNYVFSQVKSMRSKGEIARMREEKELMKE